MHVPPHAAIWATVFMGRRKEQDKQESQYREKKNPPSPCWPETEQVWMETLDEERFRLITRRRRLLNGGAVTLSVRISLAPTEKLKLENITRIKLPKCITKWSLLYFCPYLLWLFFFGIVINQILFAPYINEHILLEKIPISVVWFRLFGFGRRRGSDKWLADAVLTIS